MEKEKKVCTTRIAKEPAFSSIKRMFGQYVSATEFQHVLIEMTMKL